MALANTTRCAVERRVGTRLRANMRAPDVIFAENVMASINDTRRITDVVIITPIDNVLPLESVSLFIWFGTMARRVALLVQRAAGDGVVQHYAQHSGRDHEWHIHTPP